MACAKIIGLSEQQIRYMASKLGLKLDKDSPFWRDFHRRATASNIGKKRPAQAEVMRKNLREGKMIITEEGRARISEAAKKRIAENGHPRGMLGKKFSKETLDKLSHAHKKRWANTSKEAIRKSSLKGAATRAANGTKYNPHGSWKSGWRTISNQRFFFRSRWEANYARFLELLKANGEIANWKHEPRTFIFAEADDGSISYLPDFLVITKGGQEEYHEVKGWMDKRSQSNIKRMAELFHDITLIVIDANSYRAIAKEFSAKINGWECGNNNRL